MEATVSDSAPRVGWLAPVLAGATLFAPFLGEVAFYAAAAAMLGWDLRRRRKPRPESLECGAGFVRAPGLGKVRAKDLVGATTCRRGDGVSLMLAHKRRRHRPVILDLPNEEALAAVCRSLGIGHNGFGEIDMALTSASGGQVRSMGALGSAALSLGALACEGELRVSLSMFLTIGFMVWMIAAFFTWMGPPPILRLTRLGIHVPLRNGVTFIPFHVIENIEVNGHALALTIATQAGTAVHSIAVAPASWTRFAPSFDELEHTVEQVRAAVDRAHGRFAPKNEPEALAAMLERGAGETLRSWLARVDTIGVGAGYRATAADTAELWALLEDPEATANVRAAAARLLSRTAPAQLRVRVGDVLASVRDERTRTRIAASIDEDALAEEERFEAAIGRS